MERGQREMRVKRGSAVNAGDLAQLPRHFRDHRIVVVQHAGVVHAAEEAARHDLACRHAMRKLGAHPGAGHQAPPLVLGNQEAEAHRRLCEIGGVEPERHGHRGTVGDLAEQFRQPRVHRRQQGRAAVRLAGHHHAGRPPASRHRCARGSRCRSARRSRRAPARTSTCSRMAGDTRIHHLAEAAFERAEQRRGLAVAVCAALARSRQDAARRGCRTGWPVRRSAAARLVTLSSRRIAAVDAGEQRLGQVVHRLLAVVLFARNRPPIRRRLAAWARAAVPCPSGSWCPSSAGRW